MDIEVVLARDRSLSAQPSTALVSANLGGHPRNSQSYLDYNALSGDGRYVAFYSLATDLIVWSGAPAAGLLGYVRDTCLGSAPPGCVPSTHLVSTDTLGNPVSLSTPPSISGDGHYVAFSVVDSTTGIEQVVIGRTGF